MTLAVFAAMTVTNVPPTAFASLTEEHDVYLSKGSSVFLLQPTTLTVKILQEIEVLSKKDSCKFVTTN
jgi:hypothetical protein